MSCRISGNLTSLHLPSMADITYLDVNRISTSGWSTRVSASVFEVRWAPVTGSPLGSASTSGCIVSLPIARSSLHQDKVDAMVISTLSVVVPAYNESEYLTKCIQSLLDQSDYIDEIIVVDNNSTDGTAELIKKFGVDQPKVVYICEPRAGVVHARNRGFGAASSDLIGRIDADTIVGPDWARSIHEFFECYERFAAVTGTIYVYDSPIVALHAAVTNWRSRRRTAAVREVFAVPGNNMALRRSSWLAVQGLVSDRTDIHEDIDLSLCMTRNDFKFAQVQGMTVKVSGRRGMSPPREYSRYNKASKETLKHHGISSLRLKIAIASDGVLHTVLWPLFRMYDRESDSVSIRKAVRRQTARDLPVFEQ